MTYQVNRDPFARMHVVLKVFLATQAMQKAAKGMFQPFGITLAQFNILNLVSGQLEGIRASDLARAMIVDPSNVTGLLKRMKSQGLLRQLTDSGDLRQHVVAFTPKGKTTWSKASLIYARALAQFDALLSVKERDAADNTLQKLIDYADGVLEKQKPKSSDR